MFKIKNINLKVVCAYVFNPFYFEAITITLRSHIKLNKMSEDFSVDTPVLIGPETTTTSLRSQGKNQGAKLWRITDQGWIIKKS